MLLQVLKFLGIGLLFIVLTLFTQVGGVILLGCLPLFRWINNRWEDKTLRHWLKPASFLGVYLLTTILIIPLLAHAFGRTALPVFGHQDIKPLNIMTCLLNRHYVKPELKATFETVALKMEQQFPGTKMVYLDANFPFIDHFPLLPHLSHNDGKKLDIALFYTDVKSGELLNGVAPSFMGYGVFEGPKVGERNRPAECMQQGWWQYSFMEKIIPQGNKKKMLFDGIRTKAMVQHFATQEAIGKIFIEPHLKDRLGLHYSKVRFHGCQAVRHDDHIHVQLK